METIETRQFKIGHDSGKACFACVFETGFRAPGDSHVIIGQRQPLVLKDIWFSLYHLARRLPLGLAMNLIDAKAKILLADDDDEVLAALSSVLTSEGYEVIVAKNGREAIEHFREQHIDVALLDLNMPVKGGWEAFERLTTIHPLLQVIVITARPDQYPLAIAAGVNRIDGKASGFDLTAANDRRPPS